jgi:Peptidase family M48
VPRAGGLFGSRNYLVLGLPYLLALTADEFRGVVGHELGHLSRSHGRFGAFVYRIHQTWAQLLGAFEERDSIWTGVIRRFFEWYVPYFSAYTLPIMRAHEFEADDAAAEVAGREAAASGLVSGLLVARWVEDAYWPTVYRQVDELANRPATAFEPLGERVAEAATYGNVALAFTMLVEEKTAVDSSHPSLGERLEHLGVDPDAALAAAVAPGRIPAVEAYLGGRAAQLVAAVDARWAESIQPLWLEARDEALIARRRFEYLNGAVSRSADDELERAGLTERFESDDAALALYWELLNGEHDAAARSAIGRILREQDDDLDLSWLE